MQRLTVLGAELPMLFLHIQQPLTRHLSFISRPLLFLVIRLMFQTHHIKIYHWTWQSIATVTKRAFIVAIHFSLANDLRVFLSWTPMKMSTIPTDTLLSSESAEAFVPLKSHLIGIMTML